MASRVIRNTHRFKALLSAPSLQAGNGSKLDPGEVLATPGRTHFCAYFGACAEETFLPYLRVVLLSLDK